MPIYGLITLPGDRDRAFLRWQTLMLSDRSAEARRHALLLRQAASADTWAPNLSRNDEALFGSRLAVAEFVRSNLKGEPQIPVGWFGAEIGDDPAIFAYHARAATMLSIGAGLLVDPEHASVDVRNYLGIAFGLDALHVSVADFLGGDPFFPDPPFPPPGGFTGLDDVLKSTCALGIGDAMGKFAVASLQRPRPWGVGNISNVYPSHACSGDVISLLGAGFGATKPANVEVMFSTRGGGCVAAQVVSWSDAEVRVVVPPDAGYGCVGFIESPESMSGETIFQAATELAGEIESCLGLAGFRAAQAIHKLGTAGGSLCPTCNDPRTRFGGGPPIVDYFLADGHSVADVAPGATVVISWSAIGADSVDIVQQPPSGPLPPLTGPFSTRQQISIGPVQMQIGDRGTYVLIAKNACGTASATLEIVCKGKRALVFSGGGSKGAFEVGAARCLYDTLLLRPDILSGSSVGALNAAKLAEGSAALPQLESLWLGLKAPNDFYIEPGWFKTLDPLVQTLLKSGSSNIGFQIAAFVADFAMHKMLGTLTNAMGVPGWAYTIMTSLYPAITKVIDIARLIDAAVRALNANALFINTPLVNLINANISPTAIGNSGITLRTTMVSLETGRTEVVTETGSLVGTAFLLPLRDVLLASASIPIAFPPVAISGTSRGTEHFIDGGTRDNVPIREAVRAGAHIVYAVILSPLTLPAKSGFAQAKLLDIAPRALEVMMDEMQADDVGPFRGFGVPVITISPTFLVHDTLTIDPGLISINMDYGYMRAFDDAVAPASERARLRQMSDEITLLRLEAWAQEYYANGEWFPVGKHSPLVAVPDPAALQFVRDHKLEIRTKTKDRVAAYGGSSVPAQPERWWQAFERHAWQPIIPDPWSELISRAGTLAAAPVPLP